MSKQKEKFVPTGQHRMLGDMKESEPRNPARTVDDGGPDKVEEDSRHHDITRPPEHPVDHVQSPDYDRSTENTSHLHVPGKK